MCIICLGKEYILEKKIRKIEEVCQGVLAIPTLPKVKKIICANTRVVSISHQPDLEYLDCSGCINLKNLPRVDPDEGSSEPEEKETPKRKETRRKNYSLRYLDCSKTNITEIPEYNNLIEIDCSHCPVLQGIINLPNLRRVLCWKSSNMAVLSNLPNLRMLVIMASDGLKMLQNLPSLRDLTCSYCKELKFVKGVPILQEISCVGCVKLTHINEFEIATQKREIENLLISNNEEINKYLIAPIKLRL